jgi:DNA end-binding protein Ku
MFVAEDVHSQAEIEEAVGDTQVKEPELALARQVIDSLVGEFDPADLTSEYRRDLRAMLEAKLAGTEIAEPEPVPEAAVVDLMEALRRSVAEITDKEGTPDKKGAAKPRSRKRAAAR